MMSQRAALSSLFADDPFFSQERLLWPLHQDPLSSLQQDFFNRRSRLATSLLRDLQDGPGLFKLGQLPLMASPFARLRDDSEQQKDAAGSELQGQAQQAKENDSDLLVTLDARGYAPNDITVKLEGRSLAVVAMKQAASEEAESCSSASASASFCSAASSKTGFARRIELPPHLDLSGLSCSLMDDGQLRIHAPVARQAIQSEEQEVPVRYRTSLEFPITENKTDDNHTLHN